MVGVAMIASAVALLALVVHVEAGSSLFTIGFSILLAPGDKCGFEVIPAMMQAAFDVAILAWMIAGPILGTSYIYEAATVSLDKLKGELGAEKGRNTLLNAAKVRAEANLQIANKKAEEARVVHIQKEIERLQSLLPAQNG